MAIQILADNVAGTVADQTAVESNKTPFLPGRVVEAYIITGGITGTVPSILIESSPDNTTWTTVLECDQITGGKVGNVTCAKYMRAGVDTAGGTLPGRYSAWLRSGD
jgi:hypothetical protein